MTGSKERDAPVVTEPLTIGDGIDLRMVELFFYAYRDFITDADEMLADYGYGRAHHRVLHFVNRRPGLSVAELLAILRITKQSLGPVLRDLIESGHLTQMESSNDRRKRLLHPTEKGRKLSLELTRKQSLRIHNALQNVDGEGRRQIERFLYGMVKPEELPVLNQLMEPPEGIE